jgi:hypothetical protein
MAKKKGILIVVSNPAISTTTGWPVGFWASELTHAYDKFQEEGFEEQEERIVSIIESRNRFTELLARSPDPRC